MKLLFVCNEPPFPPDHGGRADIWRRLLAMKEAGVEIFLVFWISDTPELRCTEAHFAAMREVCAEVHGLVIQKTVPARLRRMALLLRHHSHIVSRMSSAAELAPVLDAARAFKPQALWLESVYGAQAALRMAHTLDLPVFVRSANVEHLYAAKQAALSSSRYMRLRWSWNLHQLRRQEFDTLGQSRRFYDISADDLRWWHAQGLTQGHWLASTVDSSFARRLSAPWSEGEAQDDVGYLGNLFMPNNVHGLIWYLDEVVPRLRRQRPGLRLFIAGSKPTPEIQQACARAGVELRVNPPDAVQVLRSARVLVNPVFAGSGVNIKSVDMLLSPAALVSTPVGLGGLPEEVKQEFVIADQPESFAQGILQALDAHAQPSARRVALRALFEPRSVHDLVRQIAQEVRDPSTDATAVASRTVVEA